jgi:hypothetical protein
MIENVIQAIDTDLKATGFFQEMYGLAEQLVRDGNVVPGIYTPKGDFVHPKIDTVKGMNYHRVNGSVRRLALSDDFANTGCDDFVQETWPMLMFYAIPRDLFKPGLDCQYLVQQVAQTIRNKVFAEQLKSVEAAIKAYSVSTADLVSATDNAVAWNSEYRGNKMQVSDRYMLGLLTYTVAILGDPVCFDNFSCANGSTGGQF